MALNISLSRSRGPIETERPSRWDQPFQDAELSDVDIDRILELDVFRRIDPQRFPAARSLRDTLRNDARLVRVRRGAVIVREGDYGGSVFVVIKGSVRVLFDNLETRGSRDSKGSERRSFLGAFTQLWRNDDMPEVRDVSLYDGGSMLWLRRDSGDVRPYIKDIEACIANRQTRALGEGDTFGEIAALSRTPRTATVFAETDCEMVELRWQGLRDIRRRDANFRHFVDELYRGRSLATHLREAELFAHLSDETIDTIASQTLFETHGEYEWFTAYKRIEDRAGGEVLQTEPLIAEQGHYLDGLIMIRSGFARITERLDHGEWTVDYRTTNGIFGLEELYAHWRDQRPLILQRSLRAIGYVDLLRVPTKLIEEHVLPQVDPQLLPEVTTEERDAGTPHWQVGEDHLPQSLVDFLVDTRTINGTATMVIDTDRCTGCDDCVRACASTHNNNPRFVRHGPNHGNFQVTNACMHCNDPVCLIGCPTGAIGRNLADGRVLIDDRICIGCGTCANSCPYFNIRMVEIRDKNGGYLIDEETSMPIVKATKCDLCYGQPGGPACQRACPHDALIRVDMSDRQTLLDWVNRS